MLRRRNSLPSLAGLGGWLAIAAIFLYTKLASAQQTSTTSTLAAPELTAAGGESAVELSWTAVTGAVRYDLYAWNNSVDGWQQIGWDSLTDTTYSHTDATAGLTYYYAVRAVNAEGETSAWSDYVSATASSVSTPTLTAEATASGIELSWAEDAVRYELWTWTGTDGWRQIGGDSLTDTSYTHKDVAVGTTYFYTVRAVNAEGETSGWAQNFSATALQEQQHTATPTATADPTATPTATPTVTPTPANTDRGALVALYNSTDGANWRRNTKWLSNQPLSSWYGVTLHENGRVGELRLSTNQLRGTIPNLQASKR